MSFPRRILVPVDFSDTSRHAARTACDWARSMGAHLVILHVIDARYTSMLVGYGLQVAPMTPPDLDRIAREGLDRFVGELPLQGVSFERALRVGLPGEEILAAAGQGGIDLLVMGTHGRTGLRRMIIGSETEHVLRQSPVPVLVVRHPSSN